MNIDPAELQDFLESVRNDWGDPREIEQWRTEHMGNETNFWAKALPAEPVQTTEQQIGYLLSSQAYRDGRQRTSASALYSEPAWYGKRPQPKVAKIYETVAPRELGDYVSAPKVSKHARKPNESAQTFLSRYSAQVERHLEHLPAAEQEQIRADVKAAIAERDNGQTHEQLRQQLDAAEATGSGLFGNAAKTAEVRSAFHAREHAATDSLRNAPTYQSVTGNVPSVDLYSIGKAEEAQRAQAVAARYSIPRPSGDGLVIIP